MKFLINKCNNLLMML